MRIYVLIKSFFNSINIKWILSILSLCAIVIPLVIFAQDENQNKEDLDPLRFYKAKYDATYKIPIETVAEAVRSAIGELDCVIVQDAQKANEEGWIKYIIKSDYCVFSEGDSTFDKLKYYSYEMPFIRGGKWKNGRMQYKFVITEQPDETVYILLKGSLSGYEDFVTNRVHFWESNGIFEHDMLASIEKHINLLKKN